MSELDGYEVPVCRALTKYPTISGLPRGVFILYVTTLFLFLAIYKAYWLLIIYIPLYLVLKVVTKKDPLFMKILYRYVRDRKYFYGG
ncbi:MAG: VirB3 family type IV secretion system protein [Fusobacterium varium]|uniref:VirB3 family type IV secretion system protein n=1 Tax=Fusobacterium varium TaxID=856 RepID=UPI0024324BA7|nr:VirB3 family type IV secretion system protein [Fusobacterium varium]MCF0171883.1 VirB3 family type IV secretion system protein [Fusobacterium varium]